jgi:hypothetical protein
VPTGIQQGENLWSAPFADYTYGDIDPNLGYLLSAIIGSGIILLGMFIIVKLVNNKK